VTEEPFFCHYQILSTNRAVFQKCNNREATLIHDILHDYEGVLVSDFYPGYDGMKCRQQKCLVHLIRNLNDDLWKIHLIAEYEAFVKAVAIFGACLADVDKYGLKTSPKQAKAINLFLVCLPNDDGIA